MTNTSPTNPNRRPLGPTPYESEPPDSSLVNPVHVAQETVDISGFGGTYEDGCQRMLWRGVAFLAERQPPLSMWEGVTAPRGFHGVVRVEDEDAKALERHILRDIGATGLMHQAVMEHLSYIHKHGVEAWRAEARAKRPEDMYVWEGLL